jgi:hypothetical protein
LDTFPDARLFADAASSGASMDVLTFVAVDEHGNLYRIYGTAIAHAHASNRGDPDRVIPSQFELTTDDGQHVNRISKGVYEISQTGHRLKSDDREAP